MWGGVRCPAQLVRIRGNFLQRARQPFGISRQQCPRCISKKFSLSRHFKLHQLSKNRSQNQKHQTEKHYDYLRLSTSPIVSRAKSTAERKPDKEIYGKHHYAR